MHVVFMGFYDLELAFLDLRSDWKDGGEEQECNASN